MAAELCLIDYGSVTGDYQSNAIFIDANSASLFLTQPTGHITTCYVEKSAASLTMTAQQGSQIATAIALCWAVGAVFRIIFHQLKSNESVQND